LLEQPIPQIPCLKSAAARRKVVRTLGHTDSQRASQGLKGGAKRNQVDNVPSE
jgi:hypothetical protein